MDAEEAARAALRRAEAARSTATPLKEQIERRRILASYADDYDALPFRQAFNAAKAEGRSDFPWRGNTYSTRTAEEQGREIKAAAGSGRGASAGRTAQNVSTAPMRRAESAGPVARTDEAPKPRMTASDIPGLIARGMMEGADRVPAGRGLGAMFLGGVGSGARAVKAGEAVQAAKRAAEAEKLASRVEPAMKRLRPEDVTDDLVRSVVDRAYEKTYGAGFKKGGKVKTYAKGGSVRGAGCETRHKKTRFV